MSKNFVPTSIRFGTCRCVGLEPLSDLSFRLAPEPGLHLVVDLKELLPTVFGC
jgi:hypothetical protein